MSIEPFAAPPLPLWAAINVWSRAAGINGALYAREIRRLCPPYFDPSIYDQDGADAVVAGLHAEAVRRADWLPDRADAHPVPPKKAEHGVAMLQWVTSVVVTVWWVGGRHCGWRVAIDAPHRDRESAALAALAALPEIE